MKSLMGGLNKDREGNGVGKRKERGKKRKEEKKERGKKRKRKKKKEEKKERGKKGKRKEGKKRVSSTRPRLPKAVFQTTTDILITPQIGVVTTKTTTHAKTPQVTTPQSHALQISLYSSLSTRIRAHRKCQTLNKRLPSLTKQISPCKKRLQTRLFCIRQLQDHPSGSEPGIILKIFTRTCRR